MAQIFPLSEGVFTIGHDKNFVPFDLLRDKLNDRPVGSLLVEVQPFLVVTEQDVILLDTGLGFRNEEGELQIVANLNKHGYSSEQVTKVLLSHLHKDHAGGVVYDEGGVDKNTFPNATYYIYRAEADYALQVGYPSYFTKELEPLFATKQVQWLDGERGWINDMIYFEHSGAHCPQHIVFLISDGEKKIFFGGDEAPQLKQMKIKYVAKYDYDGKKAMQLREEYAERGIAEGWLFLFYHDVQSPVKQL